MARTLLSAAGEVRFPPPRMAKTEARSKNQSQPQRQRTGVSSLQVLNLSLPKACQVPLTCRPPGRPSVERAGRPSGGPNRETPGFAGIVRSARSRGIALEITVPTGDPGEVVRDSIFVGCGQPSPPGSAIDSRYQVGRLNTHDPPL